MRFEIPTSSTPSLIRAALDGIEKVRAGIIPVEEVLRTAPLGG